MPAFKGPFKGALCVWVDIVKCIKRGKKQNIIYDKYSLAKMIPNTNKPLIWVTRRKVLSVMFVQQDFKLYWMKKNIKLFMQKVMKRFLSYKHFIWLKYRVSESGYEFLFIFCCLCPSSCFVFITTAVRSPFHTFTVLLVACFNTVFSHFTVGEDRNCLFSWMSHSIDYRWTETMTWSSFSKKKKKKRNKTLRLIKCTLHHSFIYLFFKTTQQIQYNVYS